jgi:hypothetical protein
MTLAKADVSGIADDDLKDPGMGTFAAVIETADGEIVGHFSQHADCGIGNPSIRACKCAFLTGCQRRRKEAPWRPATDRHSRRTCDSSEDSEWIGSHGCETFDRQRACEDSTSDVRS